MEEHKPQIFTMTVSAELFKDFPNYTINLPNIYSKSELTDSIIGIKYNWKDENMMKGTYLTTVYKKSKGKNVSKINTKSFYNQISLVIKVSSSKQVNVKLFGNGKLQMTGCKDIEDALSAVYILQHYLNSMVDCKRKVFLQYNKYGILMDKDNVLYSNSDNHVVFGWFDKNTNEYVIDKKRFIFDEELRLFVSIKSFQSRSRLIYDNCGKYVGTMSIELLRNKKKLYSKFTDIQIVNGLVYVNNKIIIGKNTINIVDTAVKACAENRGKSFECEISQTPYLDDHYNPVNIKLQSLYNKDCIDIYSIMANYSLGYQINRQKLCDFLQDNGYLVKYNPETYSGLYVMFKYKTMHTDIQDGKCSCNNKCTCSTVSIIVFQSGNIIFSGAKSECQLNTVFNYFVALINENFDYIKKKELI